MGVQALPPLPHAACIMALHESYLPPHAPCIMAATGLCPPAHSSLGLAPHTVTERGGGGRRPVGGAPRTLSGDPRTLGGAPRAPYTVTPAWRVVEPAGERSHLTRPPIPPPLPHPSPGGAARTCGTSPRRPRFVIQAMRAARSAEGPRTAPSAPPHTSWRYRPRGAWRAVVQGGRGDRALRTRPQRGCVPTAPGTDTRWGVPHHHPLPHHGRTKEVIATGNSLPQGEGRCGPPGSSWPPASSSWSSPLAVPAHSPHGG